jgi:lysophospholipase L1-like esterase
MSQRLTRILMGAGAAAMVTGVAIVAGGPPATAAASASTSGWVGTWESAQVRPAATGLSATGFTDQTVRDIVHTSVGGREIRIRISNVFGATPLVVSDVHVAISGSGAKTRAGTARQVLFKGSKSVTIPAGVREFSDPVGLAVGAEANLAVSIYFKHSTGPAAWHPDALSTNYYSTAGDHSAATSATDYTHSDTSWFFLDGVDVLNPRVAGAVVAFGASTTNGVGSTSGADERYPDYLARRLLGLPRGQQLSVLNAGISGNELFANGGTNGQSALGRFLRDAVEQTGVQAIIIWEGTNDIGDHPALPLSNFTSAYKKLITIAHARNIRVIGATLQPDKGAGYWTAQGNELREAVNNWIMRSGAFDGTADFSTVLENPANPEELLSAYDSGDHLHPDDAGYQAVADAINLGLL